MKTRQGFVSNSSSSSFIIGGAEVLDESMLRAELVRIGHTEIYTSYEEKRKFLDKLFEDKRAWNKYCENNYWDNDLFIRTGTPTEEQYVPYDFNSLEGYNEGVFFIDEKGILSMDTPVNKSELLTAKLDPKKKYLIFNQGNDEGDGEFDIDEDTWLLDYSIVNDEYFRKRYPRSYKVLQLLKGKNGITKEVAYKIGCSRNG